jgi:quercetin dioxygenase-like cupin family protein
MKNSYTLLADLTHQVDIPSDGTLSRTAYQDERLKVVLFAFSAGQELSEHTASTPAILHFLSGDADVTLGGEQAIASAGTWIHMSARLPHSIRAKTSVVMLLILLKESQQS